MKKTILIAVLALGTMLSVVTRGDAADAPPAPQIKVTLHNEPVSGVSDREAFMATIVFPPGATTGRHVHPGDEFATVLEGELQLNVEGQPPRIVKAGDLYHNLQGVPFTRPRISARCRRAPSRLSSSKKASRWFSRSRECQW